VTETGEAPPMSGESIPAKELKAETEPIKEKHKRGLKFWLFIGLFVLVFFVLGIILGISVYQGKKEPEVVPSPSPSPSPILKPSSTPDANSLEGRVNKFEKRLKETDFEEEQLSPPSLDFNIRFE